MANFWERITTPPSWATRAVTLPGWANDAIGSAVSRALTPPGTGGQEAAAQQQTAQLQQASDALVASQQQAAAAATAALRAQEAAARRAEAAAVPQNDLESVRVARENRQRRLLAGGVRGGARFLGEAPVGYRMLTGQ